MSKVNFGTTQETLTDEQKAKLEEILAKYDPENLSDEDRKAMMDEMRAAGLPRSRETFQMLKDAGFQPPKPPTGQGMPAGLGQTTSSGDTDMRSQLMDMIEKLKSGTLSEKDFLSQITQWGRNLSTSTGNLFDQSV